ncbi:MAG: hypothetical protein KKB50_07990, partial [Planctomycetes bacterium]|nr:hypothetical protein [Planctomycetota bacterium]
ALDLARIDAGVPARIRFAEASKPWENVETDPRWTNIRKARCVRDGQHKYIWTPYLDTEELYDVVADPLEQNDLLADPTPDDKRVALRLRQRLEEWTNSAAPLPSRFESSQLEETVRRLHALGYLAQPEIPPSSQNSGEP